MADAARVPPGGTGSGAEPMSAASFGAVGDGPNRSTRAVYVISVAAELAGVHPQTLRIYERKGLVEPARTAGGSRRYSDEDIRHLVRIQELTESGLNLEGVKRVLELEGELTRLRNELERARRDAHLAVTKTHKQYRRDLVPVRQAVVRFGEARRLFDSR